MKSRVLLLALLFVLPFAVADEEKTPPSKPLDTLLFSEALWTSGLAEIKAAYDPPPSEKKDDQGNKMAEEIRAKFKEQGIDIIINPEKDKGAFEWLSSEQLGIRAPAKKFTVADKPVGEVIIRTQEEGDGPSDITVSIYNRGDDGRMRLSVWEETLADWKLLLDEKLKVRPEERNRRGAVQIEGWMWKTGDVAWLLEGSMSRREKRAEFIRLRMAPLNAHGRTTKKKIARRSSLDTNVAKKENGDIYIDGIPMVDQGEKGYCVVASVERVVRYYGADVDQHELAQLANTESGGGTKVDDMQKAFQRVTGKIHVRTIKHLDFDERQFEKDFKSYNRIAKREGAWYDDRDFDDWYLSPQTLWMKADKEIFREMKMEQAQFRHFNRKIQEFIDQGIPLAWTLYLGMFKEGDLPQMYGGHMRLIIGYNEGTGEIIYTDSWGKGHEWKKMDAGKAWCMTTGLYSMIPNR